MSEEQKKYITKIIKTETASGDTTPVDVDYYIKDSEARDSLTELTNTTEEIRKNLGDLSSSDMTVSGRLSSIEGDISNISGSIGKINSSIKSVEGEVDTLKTKNSSINGQISKLTTDLKNINSRVDDVESNVSSIESSIVSIDSKIEKSKLDISNISGEVDELRESIDNNLVDYIENINYSSLRTLITEERLKYGQKYRITDYKTVVKSLDNSISTADHSFDIIVEAINSSKLSENAKVCLHDGDTYFSGSNLNAWEIKYCVDNDSNRFSWADTTNGKGIIYWMKDEFGNEAPYDFKNILFTTINNLPDLFAEEFPEIFTTSKIDSVYTFHHAYIKNDTITNEDASLNKNITCKLNKIGFNYLDIKTRKDIEVDDDIDKVRSSHYLYSLLNDERGCLVLPQNVIYILHCLDKIDINSKVKLGNYSHTFKNVCMVGNQFLNNCSGISLLNLDGSNILENESGKGGGRLSLLSSNICNNTFNNCQDIISFLENNTIDKSYINHYLNGLSSNQFRNSRDIVLQCNGDLCNNIFDNSYHIDLAAEINNGSNHEAAYGIDDNSFINSKYINIHGSYSSDPDNPDDYGYCLYTFIGKNSFNNCNNFRILHTDKTLQYDDNYYNTIENNNFNFRNFRLIFGSSNDDQFVKNISILNSNINVKNTALKLNYHSQAMELTDYPCINNIKFNINSINPAKKFKCAINQADKNNNFIRILSGSFMDSDVYSCINIGNEVTSGGEKVYINYRTIDSTAASTDSGVIKRKLIGDSVDVDVEIGIEDKYIDSDNIASW